MTSKVLINTNEKDVQEWNLFIVDFDLDAWASEVHWLV